MVNGQRSGCLSLRSLFWMTGRRLLDNKGGAAVAHIRGGYFIVITGDADRIYSQYSIIVRFCDIRRGQVRIGAACLGPRDHRQQSFAATGGSSPNLVAGNWRVARISLRPRQMNGAADTSFGYKRHARNRSRARRVEGGKQSTAT